MTKLLLLTITALVATPTVMADWRNYAWTYPYVMMPKDASEIEFYQTAKLDEVDSWEYRIEIEQGLSENFDVGVYQIFAQTEGGSLKWDAAQIRTRYRLAEPGEAFMDPILYLEYRRKLDLKAQNKLEAKLILARDFDNVNFSINPLYEFFWAPGEPKHELGADIGLSYVPTLKVSYGIESVIRYETVKGEDSEFGAYLGPTLSYASGSIYYTFGYLFGLTDDANDGRFRFLMGVGL